jgi:hypothetical protein
MGKEQSKSLRGSRRHERALAIINRSDVHSHWGRPPTVERCKRKAKVEAVNNPKRREHEREKRVRIGGTFLDLAVKVDGGDVLLGL